MSMHINETVLEMHFHRALMDLFAQTLGVGPSGRIAFYKYSPQRECFVGFDQAWLMTEVSDEQLFRDLKNASRDRAYNLGDRYAGYFLQFKVMKRMVKKSKQYPAPFKSVPFGRVEIDNQANPTTGMSQHEMLFNLSKNRNVMAYYACPSVFDKSELYQVDVDLDKLHLVDAGSSSSPFRDNKKHHIFFELSSMQPTWRSEPVKADRTSAEKFARKIKERIDEFNADSALVLLDFLKDLRGAGGGGASSEGDRAGPSNDALESLTIIKLST